jgi:hypothetical protein
VNLRRGGVGNGRVEDVAGGRVEEVASEGVEERMRWWAAGRGEGAWGEEAALG